MRTRTVTGAVEGKEVKAEVKESVPEPELDNFFLISTVTQWREQKDQPAIVQADRALAAAFTQNQVARNELLADMLHQLDQHFDHLVFDLPAVLVTSDAIALASLCDGFVLVVRQGMASRPQIRGAVESMRGVPSLGIVLNSAHEGVPRFLRRAKGF